MVKIKEFSGYKFNKQIRIFVLICGLIGLLLLIRTSSSKDEWVYSDILYYYLDSCVRSDFPDGYKDISYVSSEYYDSVLFYLDTVTYLNDKVNNTYNDSIVLYKYYESFKRLYGQYYEDGIQYDTQPILIRFSIDVMVIENDNDTVYKKYSIK